MSITTVNNGRLGNQIIRNLAVSFVVEKHNLFVDYANYNLIQSLGIKLFIGEHKHDNTIQLTEENYNSILTQDTLTSNVDPNSNFFQTKEITNKIYSHLHRDDIKTTIINCNPFNERYNMNNDLFIHIRLSDASTWNPGLEYYLKAITLITFDKLYISSDDLNHIIIKTIVDTYPNTVLLNYDETKTFQYGSTCKNIILSHGSFSAIIGYLAFFSNVYYSSCDT